MSNLFKTISTIAVLGVGIAFVSSGFAQQNPPAPAPDSRSHMGSGMQGGGMMGGDTKMNEMMQSCMSMMPGRQPPNSQFQQPSAPSQPQQQQ